MGWPRKGWIPACAGKTSGGAGKTRERGTQTAVIPAQAGLHGEATGHGLAPQGLDPRLRGEDEGGSGEDEWGGGEDEWGHPAAQREALEAARSPSRAAQRSRSHSRVNRGRSARQASCSCSTNAGSASARSSRARSACVSATG
jgi:hypothetical protein